MNGRIILRLIIDHEGLGQCAVDKDEPIGVYHDRHATRPRCYRFPRAQAGGSAELFLHWMQVEHTFVVSVVPSFGSNQ